MVKTVITFIVINETLSYILYTKYNIGIARIEKPSKTSGDVCVVLNDRIILCISWVITDCGVNMTKYVTNLKCEGWLVLLITKYAIYHWSKDRRTLIFYFFLISVTSI